MTVGMAAANNPPSLFRRAALNTRSLKWNSRSGNMLSPFCGNLSEQVPGRLLKANVTGDNRDSTEIPSGRGFESNRLVTTPVYSLAEKNAISQNPYTQRVGPLPSSSYDWFAGLEDMDLCQ